jgi:hypothetical protein
MCRWPGWASWRWSRPAANSAPIPPTRWGRCVISKRLELAGESVRAALEALAVAAPGWLPTMIDLGDWTKRYGTRVDSWRLPTSQAKRQQLAQTYGSDALTPPRAVYAPEAPDWLPELPAVEVGRRVLVGELPHPHRRARPGGDHTAGGGHRRAPAGRTADQLPLRHRHPLGRQGRGPWPGTGTRSTSAKPATPPTPPPRPPATTQNPGRPIPRPSPPPTRCPI